MARGLVSMPPTDSADHVSSLLLFCSCLFKASSCFVVYFSVTCFLAATNVNQGHDFIAPQVHITDINRALAFNEQGTHLAGRARVAQVLIDQLKGFV